MTRECQQSTAKPTIVVTTHKSCLIRVNSLNTTNLPKTECFPANQDTTHPSQQTNRSFRKLYQFSNLLSVLAKA